MPTSNTKSTSTVQSQPTNPDVQATVSSLAKGIRGAYNQGAPGVFDEPLYAGVGDTTRKGWDMSLASAYNPSFSGGVQGAIDSYSKVARGDYLDGNDPAFERDLSRTLDNTAADVNSFFGASGRLGGTPHVGDLTEALGSVRDRAYLGERDRARAYQAQAAQMLPSLYSAAQLPAATTGMVGSAQDADAQARLMGRYDLSERKANNLTDWLAKLTSTAAGNAAAGGTTTTQTDIRPSTPWWQSALGLGLAFL